MKKFFNIIFILIAVLFFVIQCISFKFDDVEFEQYMNDHNYKISENYNYKVFYKSLTIATNFLYLMAIIFGSLKAYTVVRKKNKKIKNEQEDNLNNLITVLLRMFNIYTESRVTIFIKDDKEEDKIKIHHRKKIQSEHPKINYKLKFSDNEGMPGRAKANPLVIGKPDDIEEIATKIFVNHIPNEIFSEENDSKLREYYKNNFNIDNAKFNILGDLKYNIKSYFSVGLMCNKLKNIIVLSIDSLKENAFSDFELFNNFVANTGLIQYVQTRRRAAIVKALNAINTEPDNNDKKLELDEFETQLSVIDYKTDPYVIYGIIKYVLELIHKSIYKNSNHG